MKWKSGMLEIKRAIVPWTRVGLRRGVLVFGERRGTKPRDCRVWALGAWLAAPAAPRAPQTETSVCHRLQRSHSVVRFASSVRGVRQLPLRRVNSVFVRARWSGARCESARPDGAHPLRAQQAPSAPHQPRAQSAQQQQQHPQTLCLGHDRLWRQTTTGQQTGFFYWNGKMESVFFFNSNIYLFQI